ncbi:MAG: UTRA domain-containing protein, partial [Firmicutes bacterium]|nr:UTRA domain-containing protein [Bacillota bacterium]
GLPADEAVAEQLDIPAGHFVIQLCSVTYDSTFTPAAYEEKYLPYERSYPSVESEMRYAVFPDITLSRMSTFTLYTNIRISAVKADKTAAQRLLCRDGDPLLLIERIYVQQDERKIGYSRFYARQPYGVLSGISGNVQ